MRISQGSASSLCAGVNKFHFPFTPSWRADLPNRIKDYVDRSDSLPASPSSRDYLFEVLSVPRKSEQTIVMATHLISLERKRSVPELPLFSFQAAVKSKMSFHI